MSKISAEKYRTEKAITSILTIIFVEQTNVTEKRTRGIFKKSL